VVYLILEVGQLLGNQKEMHLKHLKQKLQKYHLQSNK
jgi:hypothetical protein